MRFRERIVDVLLQQGLLTPAQARALGRPGAGPPRALATQLIELGCDSITVLRAVCAETGWSLAANARLRDSQMGELPEGVDWRKALAVPFAEEDGRLLIAFADPDLAEEVKGSVGAHTPFLAIELEVRRLLDRLERKRKAGGAPNLTIRDGSMEASAEASAEAPGSAEGFDIDFDLDVVSEVRPALFRSSASGGQAAGPRAVASGIAAVWERASASLPPDFFSDDETDAREAIHEAATVKSGTGLTLPWEVEPAPSLLDAAPVGEDDPFSRFERTGTVLGRGGMAKVERARDTSSGREVALKVLHSHLLENAEEVARFAREVEILERLKHGNIVRALARGLTPPHVFVACELVDGYTAKDLVKKCAPVPAVAAARLILEVLQGVGHAHENGVVHRDLKPENFLISRDGPVKVCDFGVAGPPNAKAEEGLVGTPAYMSPEQARGKPTDERSDLFSLGTVFFELLTGRHPFQGETPSMTMHRICEVGPPLLFEEDPTVPAAIEHVVERLLRVDPAERFSSAAEPAAILEEFLKPLASRYDDILLRCIEEPEVTQVLVRSDQAEAELKRGKAIGAGPRSKVFQAALAFYRASQLDPANEEAGTLLHDVCTREGLRFAPSGNQRIVSLRMALKDDPDNPDLLLRLSDLYRKEGDVLQAVIQLKRLLRTHPDERRAKTQLMYLCGDDTRSPYGLGVSA